MNPTTPRLDAALHLAPSPRALPRGRGTSLPRSLLDANMMGRMRVVSPPAATARLLDDAVRRSIDEAEAGGAVARRVGPATTFAPHRDCHGVDLDPRSVVTTRTTMNDAAVEPATGGGPARRGRATEAPTVARTATEGKVGRSGPLRGSHPAGDKSQSQPSPSRSHVRAPTRSLLLRWDDNADGNTHDHNADDVPSSPSRSPASLCRQYTDVSALTWDGETTGTSSHDRQTSRAMSWLVRQLHRAGQAPMTGPAVDETNRPTLGRRCVTELIEEEERCVGHICADGGTAATQPPKMPVRKISNPLGARHPATDSHPSSSLPPTLPLRQATMTTVVTAESTAVASAAIVGDATKQCGTPRLGTSLDGGSLDMGTRVRFRLDTSATDDVRVAPIDDERSRPARHCDSEEPPTLRASLTDTHPPVMPVRQASLLATFESIPVSRPESPTSHREIGAAAAEAATTMLDRSSNDEPQGMFMECSSSPFAALPTTERPPQPPSRKASA